MNKSSLALGNLSSGEFGDETWGSSSKVKMVEAVLEPFVGVPQNRWFRMENPAKNGW